MVTSKSIMKASHHHHKTNTKALKLRTIQPRVAWGGRQLTPFSSNLLSVFDHEYVLATGTGFIYIENSSVHTRKSFIVETHNTDISKVVCMCLSKEGKYLAAVARTSHGEKNQLYIFIYSTHNRMQDNIKPHEIKYTCPVYLDPSEHLEARGIAFSPDCAFLAVITNIPPVGVLIFDHFKGGVFQTIPTDNIPISLSFNPMDSFRICVTGECNFVKLWRFTGKSVHAAPVSGLKKGYYSYTCHNWVPPYAEGVMVVGSDAGFVSVIQNCDQHSPARQVFGEGDVYDPSNTAVSQILVRGDVIIAASVTNLIAVFETRRVLSNKGMVGLVATLVPLAYYKLEEVSHIYGLQFCIKESNTSYTLMVATADSVAFLDMITDFDLSGGVQSKFLGNKSPATASMSHDDHDSDHEDYFAPVTVDKTLFKFHSKSINCLSAATNGTTFVTFSFEEAMLRFWDFGSPNTFQSSWLIENFKAKDDENPFHIDLHPSGLQICLASESEVKEFAVWDSQLDLIRRIPVRVPFKGSGGIPVVISQPVSLVKYSNGGHLLAVVTGKVAQIFHMFLKEEEQSTTLGSPFRIMTLTEHSAPITDLAFNRDDTMIVTTANDGSVYSWVVGATTRDKEYVKKGFAATKVAVSKYQGCKTIIVAFESIVAGIESAVPLATDVVRRRRQSSIAIRRSAGVKSASKDFSAPNTASTRDSRAGSQDLGNALAAFLSHSRSNSPISSPGHSHSEPPTTAHTATSTPFRPTMHQASASNLPSALTANRVGFLAVWDGEVTPNPTIIYLPACAKSIAIGRSHGPDGFQLCVIGLADGQIILSMLPIPLMAIDLINPATSRLTFTSKTNSVIEKAKTAFKGLSRKSRLAALSEEQNDDNVSKVSLDSIDDASFKSGQLMNAEEQPSIATTSILSSASIDMNETSEAQQKVAEGLATLHVNLSKCRVLRLVVGGVTSIVFTPDGAWIILTGEDGSVFMLSTVRKFASLENNNPNAESVQSQDNSKLQFLMVEKTKMEQLRTKMTEMETSLDQSNKDHDLIISKMVESREKLLHDLEGKMKKEIQTRDEAILGGRKEYLAMKKQAQDELETLRKNCEHSLSELELMYERKLAQESAYLDKMKQAYDEYVVHMKLDMQDLQGQSEQKLSSVETEKQRAINEAERQKHAILQYYDFIKKRNDEVIASLEDLQAEERSKLKISLSQTHAMLAEAQAKNMSNEVQASHAIQKLKVELESKEVEAIRVGSDLEWANERISKLEAALTQAAAELKARKELADKWEMKQGEMQQKIDDLERVRKTLTTQLQALRSDLVPKENELHKAAEKLQEMDREYEISLAAISEKEKALTHKHENLVALQKQVRELRRMNAQKDAALHRAAILFDEYIYSMHEERFLPRGKASDTKALLNAIEIAQGNAPTTTTTTAAVVTATVNEAKSRMNSMLITPQTSSNNNISTALQAAAMNVLNPTNVNTANYKLLSVNTGKVGDPGDGKDSSDLKEKNATRTEKLAQPHGHDLIAALKLENNVNLKLRRLNDVLRPYQKEGNVDADLVDDIEAVRREQDRHMTLMHRNFSSLQSSLDTAQQVLSSKLTHHLHDNATLLQEVNQLRSEVKTLSLENQRLTAQLEFTHSRKQEQINAFNMQFLSTDSHQHLPIYSTVLPQREEEEAIGGDNKATKGRTMPVVTPSLTNLPTIPTLPKKEVPFYSASTSALPSMSDPLNKPSHNSKPVSKAAVTTNNAKGLKSFEELLGSPLEHYTLPVQANNSNPKSNLANLSADSLLHKGSTISSMTADEKVAKIVELNLEEIKANTSISSNNNRESAQSRPLYSANNNPKGKNKRIK